MPQSTDRTPTATGVPVDADLPGHVERELASYLAGRRRQAEEIDGDFTAAVDALSDFVLGGGKRIRPTFAWWGWRGAGGAPDGRQAPAVLRAVSALELLQACALVHDDLMDDSARRRGAPTIHVAFAQRHRSAGLRGAPERFGLAAAVLLGDLALAWADDMLVDAGLESAALRRAKDPWQAMRTEVLGGQYLDVLTQARGDESTEAALRVPRLKTAAYTVERPLHLGAALAGAPPELVAAFRRFGADLGIAFQLRDDLLGVFGDPDVTGKPAGDDLREGKRTLLVALGLERAEAAGRAAAATLLRESVGDPELTGERVAEVRELLVELGAVDAVERRIATLTESAQATLAAAPVAAPAAQRLGELAIAATRRER
ncbi:geranylgeranyl pyrophosphate synthase [Longimycelium tulufanense]|uniref:Geranylgeranyl pyrophosphate synthase n=1 Tax=Longimycelium tulufanense TaxID=907463 RepID=A0A8J3FVX7_9PSEU|nr:polyprenyl synthetase family protein [Longimycelium tulufanense]GGM61628.1 geranylgeranyl pyrophosphate synthase [Longimycelium tulufanense]